MIRTKFDPSENQPITIIGTAKSLESEEEAFIQEVISLNPGITVQELAEHLYNWIKRRGITVQCTLPRKEDA